MNYTRTTISPALPFDLASVKDYLRVTSSYEDSVISALASAAAAEIEGYCDLALLSQTITATTDPWPGCTIALPVGPVAPDTVATVAVIEADGSTTPVTDGYWLEAGRYPRLHLTTPPTGGRGLQINYDAGYGLDYTALPVDLTHAIAAQAVRLYAMRGDDTDGAGGRGVTLAPQTIRICARYRKVRA